MSKTEYPSAIAKLMSWIMEMFSETMAESGLTVTNVQVDAFTSWTQFFKNIPIALIAFVLIYSDSFTKEYKSGTLLLALTIFDLNVKNMFFKYLLQKRRKQPKIHLGKRG